MVQFCNLICAYVNEKKVFVSNWHYDHLCDLVHTYVDELKFVSNCNCNVSHVANKCFSFH